MKIHWPQWKRIWEFGSSKQVASIYMIMSMVVGFVSWNANELSLSDLPKSILVGMMVVLLTPTMTIIFFTFMGGIIGALVASSNIIKKKSWKFENEFVSKDMFFNPEIYDILWLGGIALVVLILLN